MSLSKKRCGENILPKVRVCENLVKNNVTGEFLCVLGAREFNILF